MREFTDEEKRILEEEKKATELSKAPLKMTIRIGDIIHHGATVGCPGCKSAIKQSRNRLPHSIPCRSRFEKVLAGEDRAKRAKRRADDYVSKVIEEDDLKRNPKKAKVESTEETKTREKAAEDVPVEAESDSDNEGEGPVQPSDGGENPGDGRRVRRKVINLLEGGAVIRDVMKKKGERRRRRNEVGINPSKRDRRRE